MSDNKKATTVENDPAKESVTIKEHLGKIAEGITVEGENLKNNSSNIWEEFGETTGRWWGFAKDSCASAWETTKSETKNAYDYLTTGWGSNERSA